MHISVYILHLYYNPEDSTEAQLYIISLNAVWNGDYENNLKDKYRWQSLYMDLTLCPHEGNNAEALVFLQAQ